MIELLIDSCSDIQRVILTKQGKLVEYSECDKIREHAEHLLVQIDLILQNNSLTIQDIDCFGVVVGSGSFTGIRVGIATCKAFCYVTGKKAKAITSCEAIAYSIGITEKKIAAIDAKQNKLYVQVFDGVKCITDIESIEVSELATFAAKYPGYKIISQIEVPELDAVIIKNNTSGIIAAANLSVQISGNDILPIYVRKPQAECGENGK